MSENALPHPDADLARRLDALRVIVSASREFAPAIKNQVAILINDTLARLAVQQVCASDRNPQGGDADAAPGRSPESAVRRTRPEASGASQPQQPAPAEPAGYLYQHDETGRTAFRFPDDRLDAPRWHEFPLYRHPLPYTGNRVAAAADDKRALSEISRRALTAEARVRELEEAASLLGACSECGKTSTRDSMWALYCLQCVEDKIAPALWQERERGAAAAVQPPVLPLTEEEIRDVVFAFLRGENNGQWWRTLTYESGPYAVICLCNATLRLARAIEAKVRGSVHPAQRSTQGARTEPGGSS